MLGPALARLFAELDKRKTKLTPYEELLHQELLAARSMSKPGSKAVGVGKPASASGSNRKTISSGGPGGSMPGLVIKPRGSGAISRLKSLDFVVDLSPAGSGVPQLQIGCTQVNCPNKKRK
jgi:hypothetical protein